MRLLIAIPVYNERKYVGRVLDKIRQFHPDLLVVDDGSTDGTGAILDERAAAGHLHVVHHAHNRGYGQSLIDAFAYADAEGYDWVITMDCDEQHEPEMIPEFVREIRTDRWDLISGSRYLHPRGDDDLPPGDRRTINANLTTTLNELFHLGITDAFCGYKAHRVSATRRLELDVPGYAFPMQLWPQVWHAGLRLTELPVRLIYNDPTRHFGGNLDDAGNRLRHYLQVLHAEIARLSAGQARHVPPVRTSALEASPLTTSPLAVLPLAASQTVSRPVAGASGKTGGSASAGCEAASGKSRLLPPRRAGGSTDEADASSDAADALPCLCSE